jgi:hypothetical protein
MNHETIGVHSNTYGDLQVQHMIESRHHISFLLWQEMIGVLQPAHWIEQAQKSSHAYPNQMDRSSMPRHSNQFGQEHE